MSLSCDTDAIARSRGLLSSSIENTLITGIIRANAIRLILRAASITPSNNPSRFSDVDNKLSSSYAGYIAKARELKCIQDSPLFRPFDYTSEGEYAKMAVCALRGGLDKPSENGTTFSAAPSTSVHTGVTSIPTSVYPSSPISGGQNLYGGYTSF